jgi:hypothetical protein
VCPGFAPNAAELEIVADICRRLDGMPLAIELTATRTRMMHPSSIMTALGDRFRLLTGGGRTRMDDQPCGVRRTNNRSDISRATMAPKDSAQATQARRNC